MTKSGYHFLFFYLLPGKESRIEGTSREQFDLSFLLFIIKYDIKRAGSAIRRMRKPHSQAVAYLAVFFPNVEINSMVITYSRVWINRVRLPILLVVS